MAFLDNIGLNRLVGNIKNLVSTEIAKVNLFKNIKIGSTTLSASSNSDTFELVEGSNITIGVDEPTNKITISSTGGGIISSLTDLGVNATAEELNYVDGVTSNIQTQLNGKANSSHGTHVPSTCTTITDWNSATSTGWYMASSATNAPTTGAWYFGYVVAHNTNYVYQEVYQFTASTDAKAIPKYIRAKMNGTWGAWTNVTVAKAVPSNAVFTDNNTTYSTATTSANGLMSSTDKVKLDAITASADAVSFTRSLTSGTKVGTININGTGTDLYAPTNTDTHYTTGLKVGASATATANAAATNGNVYLNVLDNTTVRDSHKIVGSGATTVTCDANGVITISSTDTNTNTDTKNTAGSTDSSSKLFLVGATSQSANPQTYSHNTAYVGTDGCLYSNNKKVSTIEYTTTEPSSNLNNGTVWIA